MAVCRGAWRSLLSYYLFLVLFLQPSYSLLEQGYYVEYKVEPELHVSKRSLLSLVPSPLVATSSNATSQSATSNNAGSQSTTPALQVPCTPKAGPILTPERAGGNSSEKNSSSTVSPSPASASANGSAGATAPASATNTNCTDSGDFTFPEFPSNKTLAEHNIVMTKEDHHKYYNSTFYTEKSVGISYWVDMTNRSDVVVNELLSRSHRRAVTVRFSFDFPFYGHTMRNVTIATGGFLFTGDFLHSWLAATQYIAPLMANFDSSLTNTSFVKYVDNGTAFTVQWERVVLHDRPTDGEFTFQTTLHSTGDIVFVYQQVPMPVDKIEHLENHPVNVGLADAYIVDRNVFFMRRKTVYEYHRLKFTKEDIKNWTVIYLKALPTCIDVKDCRTCLSGSIGFDCQWCEGAHRCSDGVDRFRQNWMFQECHVQNYTHINQCEPITSTVSYVLPTAQAASDTVPQEPIITEEQSSGAGAGTIVFLLLSGVLVITCTLWFTYAYRNPHTASGQILIKYRPCQWRWRRGEARYTAATIHM